MEKRIVQIHFGERDLRDEEGHDLQPNGFTEARKVNDFPVRDRKVVLHVRRRRWLDWEGRSVTLNRDGIVAEGTGYSKEFADVLKKYLDAFPIAALFLEKYFKVDGRGLERAYKDKLSGFRQWEQGSHAKDWGLLPQNMGPRMSLDEWMHAKDLFIFLTNKEGHWKKGTLAAVARGTKVADVELVLMQIPEEQRLAVEEVTMDFSDSMYQIAKRCFPNATIVIYCFHIVQRVCEAFN